ncbi:MAG TPA: hypothetical protein VJR89_35595 [Polyangiales bacterium]|nr:hypothetical protein [Polyangiales bacterium]
MRAVIVDDSRALEAGADEYLIEPFHEAALREKLILMGLIQ